MKPNRSKLFYVPQRPYMTLGTLRDQVIYPDTHQDQKRKRVSDEDLEDFLTKVLLSSLIIPSTVFSYDLFIYFFFLFAVLFFFCFLFFVVVASMLIFFLFYSLASIQVFFFLLIYFVCRFLFFL